MTKAESKFVADLEAVSVTLAAWAQEQIGNGWSVEDCKIAIRSAAIIAKRS